MYNAVTRSIEVDLIPACRKLGISLRIYNPLAGGMLTGRYINMMNTKATEGRFNENTTYLNRYWKPSFFKAMDLVKVSI
jgi:aflatoxin B1 aldehyde reductase